MRAISQDLRFALRLLRKSPGFTLIAVAALALGIGANTAIFSVVNSILLRPLPYRAPERLVNVFEINHPRGLSHTATSGSTFMDWRDQSSSFEQMAVMERGSATVTGLGEPEQIPGMRVSANFFELLGARALIGRTFSPEEGRGQRHNVCVLSYSYWMRRFGGDSSAVGRKFTADGLLYTLIGILPKDFWSPLPAELFVPWPEEELRGKGRRDHNLDVIAVLKPGVTTAQAAAELNTIESRLARSDQALQGWIVGVLPLQDVLVSSIRPALLILLAAVGFVLLIACANIANLLLARAAKREREIAIRTAVGAGRWRIARQMLTESVLLAALGGLAGLLLALWGIDILDRLVPADIGGGRGVILRPHIGMDARVLAFTLAASLATGILFGVVPALAAGRSKLNNVLKEGGRIPSPSRRRVRNLLVISEVALALMLLVCAALTIKSFARMRQASPGFRTERVLTMEMELPTDSKYRTRQEQAAFFQRLLERARELPGVQSAAVTQVLPLDENEAKIGFLLDGAPPLPPGEVLGADYRAVSADYFPAMGIPLRRGRVFSNRDAPGKPVVLLVDETLVRRYFPPGVDPVGRRIKGPPGLSIFTFEIVGVVGAVKQSALNVEPNPTIYAHYLQSPVERMNLVVRTAFPPETMVRAVKQAVWSVDPSQPVYKVRTMDEVVSESIAPQRLTLALLGMFAAVALVLAALGIYGVMSYVVGQRTHEIGVRMALGAQSASVLRLVLVQGMGLAAVGVAAGLVLSLAATRVIASLLYGVSRFDPWIFAAASVALIAAAAAASYLPARRAAGVDPLISLRYE